MPGVENVPAEIIRRLLHSGQEVAARVAADVARFSERSEVVRSALSSVIEEVPDDLFESVEAQSVTAVDGALVCESSLIGDFCSAVAVTAGNVSDSGGCDTWTDWAPRSPQNREILSGVMSSLEVGLARSAIGDVIMLDGAMLSTLINISKAIHGARSARSRNPLTNRAADLASSALRDAVLEILTGGRFVAIPKYITTNEFAKLLPPDLAAHDGRTLANMALRPGEMTHFMARPPSGSDQRRQLIGPALGFEGSSAAEFAAALDGVQSCYYRPHAWTPAFRLDMTAAAADGIDAVKVLRAVRDSTRSVGLNEPFPLYLVDVFAKHVSDGAGPVIEMAMSALTDLDAKLMIAMGYRS